MDTLETFEIKDMVIEAFDETHFKGIQAIYQAEGWLTIVKRPEDGLRAWQASRPALVATYKGQVIGCIRCLTDGEITTYIVELIIGRGYRGMGKVKGSPVPATGSTQKPV